MTALPQSGFSLDPRIDVPTLRVAFARFGRVQIAPFLAPGESAELLLQHVTERRDWQVALMTAAGKATWIDRSSWESLKPYEREGLLKLAAPTDPKTFRYVFEEIAAVGEDLKNREPSTLLGQFADFMSSDLILEAVRQITGITDITVADLRATCYRPGYFLTEHSDDPLNDLKRRVAYVFGLTPEWRPEWGGLLNFHNDLHDVELGLLPRMNVLNLFAVPQNHSVSQVSSFAPKPRYAVTGWFFRGETA